MIHTEIMNLLEQHYKFYKKDFKDNFRLKIHRSISWLKKATEIDELDYKFITYWIAFNAAYADDLQMVGGDRDQFQRFIRTICKKDKSELFYKIMWEVKTEKIIELLNNKYTFQPFWFYHNGKKKESEWLEEYAKMQQEVLEAIKFQDTKIILTAIFNNLYTVRNQIIHGGATFNSSVNRSLLEQSCELLSVFVPAIIIIMMKNHSELDWGKPFYPVVN